MRLVKSFDSCRESFEEVDEEVRQSVSDELEVEAGMRAAQAIGSLSQIVKARIDGVADEEVLGLILGWGWSNLRDKVPPFLRGFLGQMNLESIIGGFLNGR